MTMFLVMSMTLYMTGLYNSLIMSSKNMMSFLVASEIMFLGIDILFIMSSLIFNMANGLMFGTLILMLSVGESAVGLGLCVTSLRLSKKMEFYHYAALKC